MPSLTLSDARPTVQIVQSMLPVHSIRSRQRCNWGTPVGRIHQCNPWIGHCTHPSMPSLQHTASCVRGFGRHRYAMRACRRLADAPTPPVDARASLAAMAASCICPAGQMRARSQSSRVVVVSQWSSGNNSARTACGLAPQVVERCHAPQVLQFPLLPLQVAFFALFSIARPMSCSRTETFCHLHAHWFAAPSSSVFGRFGPTPPCPPRRL
jgi:hypothetical protein